MPDQAPPRREDSNRRRIATAIMTGLVAVIAAAARHRLHADFWPLDNSRVAPNILAEAIQDMVVGAIVVCVWPALQRRIHAFADAKLARVHARLSTLGAHHDQHHEDLAQIQQSLTELHQKHDELLTKVERRRSGTTTPPARDE